MTRIVYKDIMKETGAIIKSLRKAKGLSTYELAELTEVSHTAIANIENGKTKNITVLLAYNIAQALECNLSKLFPSLDLSKEGNAEELDNEIEELKKELSEKEKTIKLQETAINGLENQVNSLLFHHTNYWVIEKENLLSAERDPENRKIILANISDAFSAYLKRGILSHEDIQSIIGTPDLFPNLKEWYKNYSNNQQI